jgi:hypothetical protein
MNEQTKKINKTKQKQTNKQKRQIGCKRPWLLKAGEQYNTFNCVYAKVYSICQGILANVKRSSLPRIKQESPVCDCSTYKTVIKIWQNYFTNVHKKGIHFRKNKKNTRPPGNNTAVCHSVTMLSYSCMSFCNNVELQLYVIL